MKTHSLARRLIVTVLLVQLAAAICVSGMALLYERHSHFRSFDVMLRGRADSLLGAVQDADDPGDHVMLDGTEANLPDEDVYEVKDEFGRILGRSANWAGSGNLPRSRRGRPVEIIIGRETYRVLTHSGVRVVDPGEKGGGIKRYVTIYYGSPVTRVWRAIYSAVAFYATTSLAVLALTGILMSWLLNRGLGPLRGLAAGAAQISVSSWQFSPPAEARTTSELAPLVHALESTLNGLEQSFEQQKRFVGDAAHELKTAVAVSKSSLQLLNMKPRSAQEYQAGLERCLADCVRLEELVAQMLTLARIEESGAPADYTPSAVRPAIEQVIERLATVTQSNSIKTALDCPDTFMLSIEPEQLSLLLSNILLNAIQHSPSNSTIHIHVHSYKANGEIRIIDQGDGIDQHFLPRIFERFARSDPSRSRNTGGTGLGLAISKAIADRFLGTISIASTPGLGTAVTIRLPLAENGEPEKKEPAAASKS
jgi:signal transduction histidine kinase